MSTFRLPVSFLLLCGEEALRDALVDLLGTAGLRVATDAAGVKPRVVVADADAWPVGWSLSRLRIAYGRLPCMVLSGSPLAGDFLLSKLRRGYFLRLPASPEKILELAFELSGA